MIKTILPESHSGKILSVIGYLTVLTGLFFAGTYFFKSDKFCSMLDSAIYTPQFFGIMQLGLCLTTLAAVYNLRHHTGLRYEIATFILVVVALAVQSLAWLAWGPLSGGVCRV